MKQLSKNFIKQAYLVKDDVIFNINSISKDMDACAVKVETPEDAEKLPKLTVRKADESEADPEVFFLDCYIADGDKYNTNSGFTKVIHGEAPEDEVSFEKFYVSEIEGTLKSFINRYFTKEFTWLNENISKSKVPAYAFKDSGYTVDEEEFTQIEFTEEYVNKVKEEIVKEAVLDAAHKKLDFYNYEFVNGDPTFEVQPVTE
jgi:hypothetical protein